VPALSFLTVCGAVDPQAASETTVTKPAINVASVERGKRIQSSIDLQPSLREPALLLVAQSDNAMAVTYAAPAWEGVHE
jgi:hypothetical protein